MKHSRGSSNTSGMCNCSRFWLFWTVQPYQFLVIMTFVTVADFGYFGLCNLRRVWLFCLDPLVFSLPKNAYIIWLYNPLTMSVLDESYYKTHRVHLIRFLRFYLTLRWSLFQKRVVCTKLDIYVFNCTRNYCVGHISCFALN